jgi:hypothetical protein
MMEDTSLYPEFGGPRKAREPVQNIVSESFIIKSIPLDVIIVDSVDELKQLLSGSFSSQPRAKATGGHHLF